MGYCSERLSPQSMMRTMMNRLACAVFAVVCFALCAGYGSAAFAQSASADLLVRIDQLENQMRQLTGMVEQAQFRNQQLEATLKRMQEDYDYRFQELGARGGSRAPAGPRPSANAASSLPPVGAPVTAPAGAPAAAAPPSPSSPGRRSDAFDPSEHPGAPGTPRVLGSVYANAPHGDGTPVIMSEEPRPVGAPLDLATMAAPTTDPAARNAPPRGPNGPGVVATLPPSSTPRDSFDLGYGYMLRKDYTLAEDTFRDFLKRYPSDRLSSEAQFWLGESLFQRQAYRDAADAFLAMSKKYETSAKAPDALLRLGQSLAALNEKELACATFGEVARKYPRASASVKQSIEREQKRGHC
jgi:tol-pal system protein YbgF